MSPEGSFSDPIEERSGFDRFSARAARLVASSRFFTASVAMVILWVPTWFFIRDLNLWQLVINTITTIITFLLVALLQNSQYRADRAVQQKLNAISAALVDLMEHQDVHDDYVQELRAAVGLEDRQSSK